nr:unnamed protein product [Callosobruchus analis]
MKVCDRHLGIKLSDRDILTCYRNGKKTNNKHRGVLVRFHSINTKQLIYDKKKLLKDTGLVIKEDLTEKRVKLMEAAVDKTSLKRVWSYHGNIYVLKDNKRTCIKSDTDLEKL